MTNFCVEEHQRNFYHSENFNNEKASIEVCAKKEK